MFSGKTAWKCCLATLTQDQNQMLLARQTSASATEFYRNSCNKQPHDTCTVIEYTLSPHYTYKYDNKQNMWQLDTCEGFINVKMLLHVLTLQTAPIVCISAIFLHLDFCKPHMFCNIPASLHVNKISLVCQHQPLVTIKQTLRNR